jgi:MinD-like ATPase involved in chromosome partitioning or flagellar assembly
MHGPLQDPLQNPLHGPQHDHLHGVPADLTVPPEADLPAPPRSPDLAAGALEGPPFDPAFRPPVVTAVDPALQPTSGQPLDPSLGPPPAAALPLDPAQPPHPGAILDPAYPPTSGQPLDPGYGRAPDAVYQQAQPLPPPIPQQWGPQPGPESLGPPPYGPQPSQPGQPYPFPSGPPSPPTVPPTVQAPVQPPVQPPGGPPPTTAAVSTRRPDAPTPTADDFARRRATRPSEPVATMGMRGAITKGTLGLVTLAPGRHEQEYRHDVEMVRRNFGGLRQVTVVNPKGGAGKTVAVLLLAMTFGQKRGGYVLAWDNNETQGTLGMRALQDFHTRTVRDLLRDLDHFAGAQGRVGDLSQYVRAQGEGMFDVLASDESATAGEMLNAHSFGEIREVVSRFYKLIVVDTGNNVRAQNWQAAIDATDQLVVTMSARNDSAETAARMLDHLEQQGRHRLVRQAVTVVSMPPSRRDLDIPAISRHFAARTRTVLLAPYERVIDSGEPIRYPQLSSATRNAWLKIASSVAEGL